jgi:hypothetical protein
MEEQSLEVLQVQLAGLKRQLQQKELEDEITMYQQKLAQKKTQGHEVIEILDDDEPISYPQPKKLKQPDLLACWGMQVHIPQVGKSPRILMPNPSVEEVVGQGLSCSHCENSTRIFPNTGSLANHVKFAHPAPILHSNNESKTSLKLDERIHNHGTSKRHSYSNEEKLRAVQFSEAHPNKIQRDIADELGISLSNINKWLLIKDQIVMEFLKSKKSKRGGRRSKVSTVPTYQL